jgi:hypothetical protein
VKKDIPAVYDNLTEGEKSYDRKAVAQVVKVILALG